MFSQEDTAFFSSFLIIAGSLISGFSIGFFVVAQFIYPSWYKGTPTSELLLEDSDEEDEDYDLEEEEEDYTLKYLEEFNALNSRTLSIEELNSLKSKTVEEFVKIDVDDPVNAGADCPDADADCPDADADCPDADADCPDADCANTNDADETPSKNYKKIIMSYNNETESFWYYTDHSTKILYPVLDMVARKFVITYDCKSVFVCLAPVEAPTEAPLVAEAPVEVPLPTKSIFAKFKLYNSESTTTKSSASASATSIEKKTNQFKYKGKLKDYSNLDAVPLPSSKIDYASFKQQYILNKI